MSYKKVELSLSEYQKPVTAGELIKYLQNSIDDSRIKPDTPVQIVDFNPDFSERILYMSDYEIQDQKTVKLYPNYRRKYLEEEPDAGEFEDYETEQKYDKERSAQYDI